MRIEEALFRYLSGVAGVTALLGSSTACRLYESEADADPALPYVVLEEQSDERPHALASASPTAKRVMVTFAQYGESPQSADAVHDAIYAALITFAGTMGGGPTVQGVQFTGKRPSVVPDFFTDRKLFVVETDYDLWVNL